MNQISHPNPIKKAHDFNLEHFRIRLTVRLCIIFVCLVQIMLRLTVVIPSSALPEKSRLLMTISLPFPLLMTLVIALEYFLYRKLGPGRVKYSSLVDLLLLTFFIGDRVILIISHINGIGQTDLLCFPAEALLGFSAFSWRTLMVTLIVEKWQLKVIAPITALSIAVGFTIHPGCLQNSRVRS